MIGIFIEKVEVYFFFGDCSVKWKVFVGLNDDCFEYKFGFLRMWEIKLVNKVVSYYFFLLMKMVKFIRKMKIYFK